MLFCLFLCHENIIITGTSRGIGFELALQFAKAGHQVLAISRNIPSFIK
jgi:NAD(P)-dependent dehydrogenase (short-subunit alcohol dehydrogenase family)